MRKNSVMMDKGEIIFEKIVIPKDEVNKMSRPIRKQYLMLTNMLRDLNLLQKFLVFTKPDKELGKISDLAVTTTGFFLLKLLISKEYEIWQFIKDERILDKKHKFTKRVKDELENIERTFSDKKVRMLFCFIRNKFGFHYDTRPDMEVEINEAMSSLPKITMWLSTDSSGNDIFDSSNEVMLKVIFSKMMVLGFKGDSEELLGQLFKLTTTIAGFFQKFCTIYLGDVILKNINSRVEDKISVRAPLLSKVNLPLIVKRDKENE